MFDNHLRFSWYGKKSLAGSAQPGRFRFLSYDLHELKKKGIKAIISLHGDFSSIPGEFHEDFSFHSEPVPDGYPPTVRQMRKIVRTVRKEIGQGWPCLICCRGGVGRTSTVLAVLLMELEGMSREEAMEELRAAGRIPESVDQHDFISRWPLRLRKPGAKRIKRRHPRGNPG